MLDVKCLSFNTKSLLVVRGLITYTCPVGQTAVLQNYDRSEPSYLRWRNSPDNTDSQYSDTIPVQYLDTVKNVWHFYGLSTVE